MLLSCSWSETNQSPSFTGDQKTQAPVHLKDNKLTQTQTRNLWQGIQTIDDYKPSPQTCDSLLSSRTRFGSLQASSNRLNNSFINQAVRILNSPAVATQDTSLQLYCSHWWDFYISATFSICHLSSYICHGTCHARTCSSMMVPVLSSLLSRVSGA